MIASRLPLLGVSLLAMMALGACSTTQRAALAPAAPMAQAFVSPSPAEQMNWGGPLGPVELTAYASIEDGGFKLPAIPTNKVDPQFLRQRVVYNGEGFEPGTVVVDTKSHFLYVIEPRGTAMRYGIGVGKAGFAWAGEAEIKDKQHWPKWFPPVEMIARRPELKPYGNEVGMNPGLQNPLGARALYLYQGNKDTLYRLHGTPEWWSIGKSMSSGCIRLINQDIVDLYDRVPMNARVIVLQGNDRLEDYRGGRRIAQGAAKTAS
ncbi:L,D-transpeptidase [Aureimonas jatrophae]|jgi:lipoprotein-anchoring transpeptidase ErfK/SrfK|uniref:Lipoprotein-anchoring transpeptidase ErfK/SrfK n=1 Tax=Aureimonas jatrophae TaxID=1166073 RepID=A0A1H0IQR1_9HYPH|nr:L,D-transpeptidase [Aureimonas jatrophae]MBB3952313.1 lipoprotein-anchoring transpeptidase ErfK/SrfK [Aureimonas jatrophae]SDO33819.1 Lipoprotein-anchoring transpeptidase ErfK/SrfK [Aureimonas jatrophae]